MAIPLSFLGKQQVSTGFRYFTIVYDSGNNVNSLYAGQLLFHYAGGTLPASAMTNNTSPAPYVAGGSAVGSMFPSNGWYNVFRLSLSFGITFSSLGGVFGMYITFDCGQLIIPTSMDMSTYSGGGNAPKSFRVYGSPTGYFPSGGGDSHLGINASNQTGWTNNSTRNFVWT